MASIYEIAGDYADLVHAHAVVESHECTTVIGDNGRAFGILQHHPGFFKDYYGRSKRFPVAQSDTWTEAQIKATASYYDLWSESIPLDLLIQGYNLGLEAVTREGKRNEVYLSRVHAALNQIRGQAANANSKS